MKMRYVGPPTLPRVTLIGQHYNGCCWLDKDGPKGKKIQYIPSHTSTLSRDIGIFGHLAW